jgi:transcriptional regulator with XRE-family HTH domain
VNERLRTWGINIRSARKMLGLTQEQFAEKLGVRQSSVARWERGVVGPKDDMKVKIAVLAHQDVRMLFPLFRTEQAS